MLPMAVLGLKLTLLVALLLGAGCARERRPAPPSSAGHAEGRAGEVQAVFESAVARSLLEEVVARDLFAPLKDDAEEGPRVGTLVRQAIEYRRALGVCNARLTWTRSVVLGDRLDAD